MDEQPPQQLEDAISRIKARSALVDSVHTIILSGKWIVGLLLVGLFRRMFRIYTYTPYYTYKYAVP